MNKKIYNTDKDTIRGFMDHFLNLAMEQLIENGCVPPVMVFYKWDAMGNGKREFMTMNFSDDIEKQASIATAKAKMAMDQVDAYVFVSEAWVKIVPNGDKLPQEKAVREMDGKKEALVVTGASPDFCLSLSRSFNRLDDFPAFEFEEEFFSDCADTHWNPYHWRFKN